MEWDKQIEWLKRYEEEGVNEILLDGFRASLMFAPRLEGDEAHGLPPGRAATVFHLDKLPAAPRDWVRSAGSYVVPVEVGVGLWFDWRNGWESDLNTAVLPSVKGMNPVTGMKLKGLGLEAYAEKCPLHEETFKGNKRLCEKCGYEWPPQNYITQDYALYWDGFRQPDGKVRQFFFTDEEARDIASLVIGKENTVPAFGFAFYRPKNPRIPPKTILRGFTNPISAKSGSDTYYGLYYMDYSWRNMKFSSGGGTVSCSNLSTPTIKGSSTCYGDDSNNYHAASMEREEKTSGINVYYSVPKKNVSVGAGAEIRQDLETDSLGLDGWQEKESAVIRLYFVFRKQFEEIVKKGGVKVLKGDSDGFLKGLPTG